MKLYEGLKTTLAELLKAYGGSNYKNYTIEQIKNQVATALDGTKIKSPAEKAVIIKFKNHLLKAKDAETILTEITEKMFAIDGNI